jgi:hypothetical protein
MKKNKKKQQIFKHLQRGRLGNIFIVTILALLFTVSATAVGGLPSMLSPTNGTVVKIKPPVQNTQHNNLQLETFGYVTLAPTPTKAPPATSALCQSGGVNNEPEILVGYLPAQGETVTGNGQIKVWVNDENAPIIAPGEAVDPTTGAITAPGDRTAKAPDNYIWEPALYISPQTAESGGTPHFPNFVKGDYNNAPPDRGSGIAGPNTDPIPPGSTHDLSYMSEYIWNITGLGLAPGTYLAEFVIHDGDRDRGVGCVNFTIQ